MSTFKIAVGAVISTPPFYGTVPNTEVNDKKQAIDRICKIVASDVRRLKSAAAAFRRAVQEAVIIGGKKGESRITSTGGFAMMPLNLVETTLAKLPPLVDNFNVIRDEIAANVDCGVYQDEVRHKNGTVEYVPMTAQMIYDRTSLGVEMLACEEDMEAARNVVNASPLKDIITLGVKAPDGYEFDQLACKMIAIQSAGWWNTMVALNSPNPPARVKVACLIEQALGQAEKLRNMGGDHLNKLADMIDDVIVPAMRSRSVFAPFTAEDVGLPKGSISITEKDLDAGDVVPTADWMSQ